MEMNDMIKIIFRTFIILQNTTNMLQEYRNKNNNNKFLKNNFTLAITVILFLKFQLCSSVKRLFVLYI